MNNLLGLDYRMDDNGNLSPYFDKVNMPAPVQAQSYSPRTPIGQKATAQPSPSAPSSGSGIDWGRLASVLGAGMLSMSGNQNLSRLGVTQLEDMRKTNAANKSAKATIDWLRAKGRNDLADMVAKNPAMAKEAFSEAIKVQKPIEVDGKLVDPVTMKVVYGGDGSSLSKDQLSSLNTIRDDFRTDTANFQIVSSGYKNISEFYNNPGSVSDYALAVGFAKVLDPGSVAREGEVAAVQNAGAKVPALGQALKNAITGEGQLTPEVRQQIAELTQKIYTNQLNEARSTFEHYKEVTKAAGIDPKYLYGGDFKEPESVVPAKVPESAIPAGATKEEAQKWWDSLTVEEKRKYATGGK